MISYNVENFEKIKNYLANNCDYRATNDEIVEFVGFINDELDQDAGLDN